MRLLRENYDRVVLLLAALFLLSSARVALQKWIRFNERLGPLETTAVGHKPNATPMASQIQQAMQELQSPPQWTSSATSGLFVPEKHFIGPDGFPATLRNAVLHPPVPNEWLEDFDLPVAESDVLTQDADGDGFTNLDEWLGHTNPLERDSHPSYTFKLRLRSFAQDPFPLLFSSSVEGIFGINNIDPSVPTQFLHLGDMIRGTKYRITDYSEKHARDKYGTLLDVSELTLEQADTHDRVTLVKEKRAVSPESVANFLYTWGGLEESFAVRKNEEFSLKPLDDVKYKLLDVQPDKAVIVDTRKPDNPIEIGPAQ